mgnify:FL=1
MENNALFEKNKIRDYGETGREIITNLALINASNDKTLILEKGKETFQLICQYMYRTYDEQSNFLSFLETREHWKVEPDSESEALEIAVIACFKTLNMFTAMLLDGERRMSIRPMMEFIGAYNYIKALNDNRI